MRAPNLTSSLTIKGDWPYFFPRSIPTILASASRCLIRPVAWQPCNWVPSSVGNKVRICLGGACRPSLGTSFEPGLRVSRNPTNR